MAVHVTCTQHPHVYTHVSTCTPGRALTQHVHVCMCVQAHPRMYCVPTHVQGTYPHTFAWRLSTNTSMSKPLDPHIGPQRCTPGASLQSSRGKGEGV